MSIISLNAERVTLEHVSKGDEMAFEELFNAYHQELGGYVLRLTKSLSLTEEIVQDVFFKIWTNREQLNQINNFRSYLFIVSRNHAYNVMRQQLRKEVLHQTWVEQHLHDLTSDAEPDKEKFYTLIDEAVLLLPPQQQKAWILSRREGLKHKEIASKLVLSQETVKRHISMAIGTITRYVKANVDKVLILFTFLFD